MCQIMKSILGEEYKGDSKVFSPTQKDYIDEQS